MRNAKPEVLAAELRALKTATEQIKHLDANKALVKFLVNIYGEALKEVLTKALEEPALKEFEALAEIAKREKDHLDRKWRASHDHYDPFWDVSGIELPSGPEALGMLPWPLDGSDEAIPLEIFNRRWSYVKVGGGARFTTFSETHELDFSKEGDLKQEASNREVLFRDPKTDKTIVKTLVSRWMKNPSRQEYKDGIEFDAARVGNAPGKLNLFTGFGIKPDATKDWSLFKDHLLNNVCQGDDFTYRWLMAWFAQIFQQPMKPMGTAVVLVSKEQGTGKGTVGNVMRYLFGRYSLLVSKTDQITGTHNKQLAHALLVCCEEAVWSNDKKAAAAMKSLITDPVFAMHAKFNDIINMPNMMRFLITTNEGHAAPKEAHDRRYHVIEVGSKRANDGAYFGAIEKQMIEDGGCAGLLAHLLDYNLAADAPEMKGINLRHAPQTRAGHNRWLTVSRPRRKASVKFCCVATSTGLNP